MEDNSKSDQSINSINITKNITQIIVVNSWKLSLSKKITNNIVKTQITNISKTIKNQPKWLRYLELIVSVVGIFGINFFIDDPSPVAEIELSGEPDYDTMPVWVTKNGPETKEYFDDGMSYITIGVGNSEIMFLPTKDGINFITPEGLEFATIEKIQSPYIEFDQKEYTWSEKVYISIIDPWRNQNSEYVERLSSSNEHDITISTKSGQKLDYVFEESSSDTGIFLAEILLTGFDSFDANNDGFVDDAIGTTFGKGPRDGLLKTAYADELIVSYKVTPENTITASVPIQMNIGELYLYSIPESNNIFGVKIIDPDLNLNIYEKDFVIVNISSESDLDGINLKLTETEFGAFFENTFQRASDKYDETKLFANPGERITVKYYDKTLPSPYASGEILEIRDSQIFN